MDIDVAQPLATAQDALQRARSSALGVLGSMQDALPEVPEVAPALEAAVPRAVGSHLRSRNTRRRPARIVIVAAVVGAVVVAAVLVWRRRSDDPAAASVPDPFGVAASAVTGSNAAPAPTEPTGSTVDVRTS